MDQERAERVAANETSFRRLNEGLGVMGVFVCECRSPEEITAAGVPLADLVQEDDTGTT